MSSAPSPSRSRAGARNRRRPVGTARPLREQVRGGTFECSPDGDGGRSRAVEARGGGSVRDALAEARRQTARYRELQAVALPCDRTPQVIGKTGLLRVSPPGQVAQVVLQRRVARMRRGGARRGEKRTASSAAPGTGERRRPPHRSPDHRPGHGGEGEALFSAHHVGRPLPAARGLSPARLEHGPPEIPSSQEWSGETITSPCATVSPPPGPARRPPRGAGAP